MRKVVVATLAGVLLAGCAPTPQDDDPFIVPTRTGPTSRIVVDTPALRAQKADLGIAACVPGEGHNDLPARTLPCFGGGRAVDVSRLAGPMIVNLWASWCGPCREELPVYAEFARQHGDTVPVVGVDYNDFNPGAAMQLLADSGVTYPQLADPQALLGAGALGRINPDRYLPIVVLVSADGTWHAEYRQIHRISDLEDLARRYLGVAL